MCFKSFRRHRVIQTFGSFWEESVLVSFEHLSSKFLLPAKYLNYLTKMKARKLKLYFPWWDNENSEMIWLSIHDPSFLKWNVFQCLGYFMVLNTQLCMNQSLNCRWTFNSTVAAVGGHLILKLADHPKICLKKTAKWNVKKKNGSLKSIKYWIVSVVSLEFKN